MTDQLILTTAQRDAIVAAFSTLTFTTNNEPYTDKLVGRLQNHDEIKKQLNMLQSLPMVDSEPVGKVLNRGKKILHTGWLNDIGLKLPDNTPLYTSPQALTPITADDVTDEMVDAYFSKVLATSYPKDFIAAGYNAVIKHRSEA